MPGAARIILVAEDNPVERKLLTIRLSQMGYQVVAAADGVEALEKTRSQRPDLVVSDVVMPRLDGFRLCQTLRKDAELGGIPVVLTSSATIEEDDRLLALEMGASAFVVRTPDCRDILEAVQAGLDEGAPPAPAQDSQFAAELRERFLAEGSTECRMLLESLESGFDPAAAKPLAHRWAGVGGTLGFPQISQRAFELERLVERPGEQTAAEVRRRLTEILGLLSDAARGAAEKRETPLEVVERLTRKRIALVGFAEQDAAVLASALGQAGAQTSRFELAAAPPGSAALAPADLVILFLGSGATRSPWAEPDALAANDKLLLVVGSRDALFRAGAVTRKRADDFLLDPWSPEEALLRASRILRRSPAETEKRPGATAKAFVLVADDDPTVVALVSAALNHYGLHCQVAHDGGQTLDMTRNLHPRLLILDVNMPGLDGFEVLARLQRDADTRSVPVVMLTARQHEADVLRGFGLGAADYITKPFGPLELVARVRRLIQA
jgi:DNA-binding response OmpR family regulator